MDAIHPTDCTYQISTPKELSGLVDSIKEIGLITPPILHRQASHSIVVSGFRRIDACRKLGLPSVEARILDETVSPLNCAQFAIAENSFQRDMNPVEISRALNLLDRMGVSPSAAETLARSLGLPSNPSIAAKLKKIQKMPPLLQQGIIDSQLSLDVALRLARLPKNDGCLLAEIFLKLGLSRGKQKEMLTNSQEIAARDDLRLSTVLSSESFQAILNNPDLDRRQKTNRLRAYLRQKRFPHIDAAEKKFSAALRTLKLGEKTVLQHPDYFEGTDSTLRISFKDLNELLQQLKILNQALEKSDPSSPIPHFPKRY